MHGNASVGSGFSGNADMLVENLHDNSLASSMMEMEYSQQVVSLL